MVGAIQLDEGGAGEGARDRGHRAQQPGWRATQVLKLLCAIMVAR